MTQYAYFDSTVAAPAPVIGWFDTAALSYPNLPAPANLLPMTPAQWAARMTGCWAVSAGALVAYIPTVTPAVVTVTPLEFIARLTSAEQTAVVTAGQSSAAVMLFLLKLSGATYVDATDPNTIAGIGSLVTANLLTSARATQILNFAIGSP